MPVPTQVFTASARPEDDRASLLQKANQAIYKQNVELSVRNKTLSVLHALSEITMKASTVPEVSQSIVDIIARELSVGVTLLALIDTDRNVLRPVAISHALGEDASATLLNRFGVDMVISLDTSDNLAIRATQDKEEKITGNLLDVLTPLATQEVADALEAQTHIKTILIYPLHLGEKSIGVLCLGLTKHADDLTRAEKETLPELISVVTIALDRARLREHIVETNKELSVANIKLEELDKLKDEFVSLASHELRTPLTAIRSYIWMALSGKGGVLPEKIKFYLDRAFVSANRLIKLVNDMLNISRIESGRVSVKLSRNALPMLIDEVIGEIKPKIEEQGLELTVDIAAGTEDVIADADKIKEVLINFIGNALKFTPRGGTILIHAQQKDEMVTVSVIDSGEGMRPEDIGKLFQKFSTLAPSTTADPMTYQSSGLGLYISRSIIAMHGGEVSAQSAGIGRGSTFSFSLHQYFEPLLAQLQKKYPTEGLGIIHNAINT